MSSPPRAFLRRRRSVARSSRNGRLLAPQLEALLSIGLCARSQTFAAIWADRAAKTDHAVVDAVTPQRMAEFTEGLRDDAKKKYVQQQLRLFLDAKQCWRKERMEAECADFTKRMLGLVATGSALHVPLEEFGNFKASPMRRPFLCDLNV